MCKTAALSVLHTIDTNEWKQEKDHFNLLTIQREIDYFFETTQTIPYAFDFSR